MTMLTLSYLLPLALAAPNHSNTAEQFVRRLYAPYLVNHKDGVYSPFTSRAQSQRLFSPGIVNLVDADKKRTPTGEEGVIDADPLCQCQDYDGMQVGEVKQTASTPNRATFEVTLRFGGEVPIVKKLHLSLVHQANGWRVDDVIPAEGQSLRQLLTPASRKR